MTLQIHIIGVDDEGEQIDLLFTEDELDECIETLENLNNQLKMNIEDKVDILAEMAKEYDRYHDTEERRFTLVDFENALREGIIIGIRNKECKGHSYTNIGKIEDEMTEYINNIKNKE